MNMGDDMVLDTSALISWPLSELNGSMIVNSQIAELEKFSPTRAQIIQSLGLIISEPSRDSISEISKLAVETGDMSGISQTDLSLVSLAYSKGAVLVTDDYRMQNIAEYSKIKWRSVNTDGIKDIWKWEIVCMGCKIVKIMPESTTNQKNNLGQCVECGSKLKVRKKK